VDREIAASASVLQEVHCGLLRAIEGARLTPDAAPPATSPTTNLPEASSSQAQWSERVVNAVLSATEPVGQEAWVISYSISFHIIPLSVSSFSCFNFPTRERGGGVGRDRQVGVSIQVSFWNAGLGRLIVEGLQYIILCGTYQ